MMAGGTERGRAVRLRVCACGRGRPVLLMVVESPTGWGASCGGEGCDCDTPRGLPRKKLPSMDWRAGGDSLPTAMDSIVVVCDDCDGLCAMV